MGFEFEERTPVGPMSAFVGSVWWARGRIRYAQEHIAPTDSTVAVINLGDLIRHATEGPRALPICPVLRAM